MMANKKCDHRQASMYVACGSLDRIFEWVVVVREGRKRTVRTKANALTAA